MRLEGTVSVVAVNPGEQKRPGRVAYGFTMTFMGENFRRMWNFGDS